MQLIRSVATWVGGGLLLGCGTLACGPMAASAPTPTPGDPFAVVRATSQAAYASGKAHLDRGEFLQACVDLDTARTNDPDSRPEIDQALSQALQQCLTPAPEPTSAAPARALPTLALPTTPAATNSAAPQATPVATTTAVSQSAPGATTAAATASLATWKDPQGRFSLGAPAEWAPVAQPQALFGTAVVEFRDPTGRAEVDVAVDTNSKAVSPELYAAGMELAMQQQLPGYAAEQVTPGSTAGNPSVRRLFTFTARDASGQDHQARGFQVTLVKGSTPFIVSGSAPAEQFAQFSPTFDRIVDSFQFS